MSSRISRRAYSSGDSVVVIINPNTRVDHLQVRAALGQWLPEGVGLRVYETRRDVNTRDLAQQVIGDADGVIACGGDGTVSDVAAAMEGRNIPLGIIPGGSTNIVAQELGIPGGIHAATALAFGPFSIREMDVATCNDNYFLHMAGTGLDSLTFEATDETLKRRIGWVAYVPAALKALREKSHAFHITIDDEEHSITSPLVLVANGSSIISPSVFRLDDSIRSDDGVLDVLIVKANKPQEVAKLIAHLANPMAALTDSPLVIHRKARKVRLESDIPQPIQLDGDVVDQTPASFSVIPQALSITVPTRRH